MKLFLSLAFLFMPQGFSHWSAVPGHSYRPGVVLLGQRIRTREDRNGPASQVILRIHETLILRVFSLSGLPSWSSGKTSPSSAGGAGLIPGRGAEIPHASRPKKPKHKTEATL